jgi:hypothetical protein
MVFSNTTFWELRTTIAKKVKCFPEQLKLMRSLPYKEVADNENGKTLGEFRIRASETFTVSKRPTNMPRTVLVTPEGDVIPRAQEIFAGIYHKFCDKNQLMDADGVAAFTSSCTGDNFKGTDRRIIDTVEKYDTDGDGFMTEEDFQQFYKDACFNKINVVWCNLWAHHYRNDLKHFSDPLEDEFDVTELPRYILTTKAEYLQVLFTALVSKDVANEAWELIIKLPTDTTLYNKILSLTDLDWSTLFKPDQIHEFLYTLQIIECFMDETEDKEEMARRKEWKA